MTKEESEQTEIEKATYLTIKAVVVRADKAEQILAKIAAMLKEAGY